ncbi:Unknown protein [Striga hermonthica]|uniref:Reverse transcriptase domain-containing protein n=1 Tax=Striga hermonthica TaxID=68872 RepID=A0A9N7RCT2_STRHE|nr:Unknown protein [Striga hermonthica]
MGSTPNNTVSCSVLAGDNNLDNRRMQVFKEFRVLSWNVRGLVNKFSQRQLKDLLFLHRPTFCFVMEPQCLFERRAVWLHYSGYERVVIAEATGRSGGIWLLQRRGHPFTVSVLHISTRTISISVGRGSWCVIGDWNEVTGPSQSTGYSFSQHRADVLNEFLQHCDLTVIQSIGTPFTWRRSSTGVNIHSQKCLDYAATDTDWIGNFPFGIVETLNRGNSDHNPLILHCHREPNIQGLPQPPFRRHEAWADHPAYLKVITDKWQLGNGDFLHNMNSIREASISFNRTCFGNIGARKRKIQRRLLGIQRIQNRVDSARLAILERQLLTEHNSILHQEELIWFQKSREKILLQGDRNTRFFQTAAKIHKTKSAIHGLQINNVWTSEEAILRGHAIAHFQSRFSDHSITLAGCEYTEPLAPLDPDIELSVTQSISNMEIKQVIDSCPPYSAPGDPLSPYLFVIVMEKLTRTINREVSARNWDPVVLSRGGPVLSHLLFVDDVILMAQANEVTAKTVNVVLQAFAEEAGLAINLSKSQIIFSAATPERKRNRIRQQLSIPTTEVFDKYLGFPIIVGRRKVSHFEFIIERISRRLPPWRAKFLNKAARTTLACSVLSTIPVYFMQIAWFPEKTCQQIDSIIKRIIWKYRDGRGLHLVNWETVATPRRLGGLGIRKARQMNIAMLGKKVSEYIEGPSSLWVEALSGRFGRGYEGIKRPKTQSSSVWTALRRCFSIIATGFTYRIGNGETNFWEGIYFQGKPIKCLVDYVHISDSDKSCRQMITNGRWDIPSLHTNFPAHIKKALMEARNLYLHPSVPDRWCWSVGSKGKNSVTSCYEWLLRQDANADTKWKKIWRLDVPEKINFSCWLIGHRSLPTKALRHQRHLDSTGDCTICGDGTKTWVHLFFTCPWTVQVWVGLIQHGFHNRLAHTIPYDNQSLDFILKAPVGLRFALWFMWLERNHRVFEKPSDSPCAVVRNILSFFH